MALQIKLLYILCCKFPTAAITLILFLTIYILVLMFILHKSAYAKIDNIIMDRFWTNTIRAIQ